MSAAGIGKLSPNIIMLGFMHSWKERTITDMCSYYNIIHDAFTYNYGVVILHAPQGKPTVDVIRGLGEFRGVDEFRGHDESQEFDVFWHVDNFRGLGKLLAN